VAWLGLGQNVRVTITRSLARLASSGYDLDRWLRRQVNRLGI